MPTLPMAPQDRRCSARMLNNPLRRRFGRPEGDVDRLGPTSGETVADLGAGVGFFCAALLERVGPTGRVYEVEPDERNLAAVRAGFAADPRVVPLVGSAAHVPEIPDGSVDRVLLSLVLCCMVDKEGAMDEAWRILRPGGRALVTYPRRNRPRLRPGPSLRVRPDRWQELAARRPWARVTSSANWAVQRHLLERGPAGVDGADD